MISFLKRFFIEHWQRKCISIALAIIIWIVIHHSMTINKTIASVPVRIINLPPGKTIEGMLGNGVLNTKIQLSVNGHRESLEQVSGRNLEVVIDAEGQPDQWIANITKKNLVCINTAIDIEKAISRVIPQEMILKQTKLVSEKIPVLVTQPIGEAPKGYQFLDVWPYQLQLSVTGPEEIVKKLKIRGLKLTFNLNDMTRSELDSLQADKQTDEISFLVPASWKKVTVPQLSETPLEIDDPLAKSLRIDFSRQDFLSLSSPLPITTFFPAKYSHILNPETHAISVNDFVIKRNGIKMVATPLYAQGVSRLFLDIVKDMVQIVVIAAPKSEREHLLWSAQFLYPHELENRYVAKVLADATEDAFDIQPNMREDYLRNRFRRYMNRFRLYTANHKKLDLKIELQPNAIFVSPSDFDHEF